MAANLRQRVDVVGRELPDHLRLPFHIPRPLRTETHRHAQTRATFLSSARINDWKDTVRKTHPASNVFKAGDDIDRHPGRKEEVTLLCFLALRRVRVRLQISGKSGVALGWEQAVPNRTAAARHLCGLWREDEGKHSTRDSGYRTTREGAERSGEVGRTATVCVCTGESPSTAGIAASSSATTAGSSS